MDHPNLPQRELTQHYDAIREYLFAINVNAACIVYGQFERALAPLHRIRSCINGAANELHALWQRLDPLGRTATDQTEPQEHTMTHPTLTPEQHAALREQHEAIRYTLALMQINALCVEHCREEAPDRAELALQRIKGYVEQTNAELTLFWDQISALLGIARITPTA